MNLLDSKLLHEIIAMDKAMKKLDATVSPSVITELLNFLRQIVVDYEELKKYSINLSDTYSELKSKYSTVEKELQTVTGNDYFIGQKRARAETYQSPFQTELYSSQDDVIKIQPGSQKQLAKPTTILVPNDVSNEQILEMLSKNQAILKSANNGPINIQRISQNSTAIHAPIGGTSGFINATPVVSTPQPPVGIPIKIITKSESTAPPVKKAQTLVTMPEPEVKPIKLLVETVKKAEPIDDSFEIECIEEDEEFNIRQAADFVCIHADTDNDNADPTVVDTEVSEILQNVFTAMAGEANTELKLKYPSAHIGRACAILINSGEYGQLEFLLNHLPDDDNLRSNQELLRAKCAVLYQKKDKTAIQELYKILNSMQFAAEHHKFLQQLWYNAHYLEEEMRINFKRDLGAVDKYRIRKRWPPPSSIWDGEPTKKGYRIRSREIMKQYYETNKYPSLEDRRMLAYQCQLNMEQVKNWFKNRRKRESDKNIGPGSISYNPPKALTFKSTTQNRAKSRANSPRAPIPRTGRTAIMPKPPSTTVKANFFNLHTDRELENSHSYNSDADDTALGVETIDMQDSGEGEYIKPEPLDSDDELIIDSIPNIPLRISRQKK